MFFEMHRLLLMALFFKWANGAAVADDRDPSFKSFCFNPPNFGVGDYDDENQECRVTYTVKSLNDDYAQGFCDKQHPFTLLKAESKGDLTICHLAIYYKCDVNEFLIGDRCYITQTEAQYNAAASACSDLGAKGMSIHKITSLFEQKWIAAFFTSYKMMWIENTKKDLTHLKVASFKDKVLDNMEGGLVSGTAKHFVIITSKGALTSARGGTITAMSGTTHLPVLCSRSASANSQYAKAYTEKMREAGIVSHLYKGHDGRYRPFTILRVLVEFEMGTEFAAGGKRLHYACKSLKNGYAATPLDFENVEDFKEMLRKEKVNIVGVPGSRSSDVEIRNTGPCVKDTAFESHRRQFFFELKNGGLKSAKDDKYWRPTFPDRYCADTPRVALGFSQEGLVDIPNAARMFVACTFGEEVKEAEDEKAAKCSKHASYDKKTDTCSCNQPFEDLTTTKKFHLTDKDKNEPKGHYCVNCDRAHDHEIAIVVENNHESSVNRYATLNILRAFAFLGLVSNSRMKLYTFDSTVREGKYRTPTTPVEKVREHFESDFPMPTRNGAKLAPALNAIYDFFQAKSSNRKLVVLLLSSVPSDLDDAIAVRKKLDGIGMRTHVFSYTKDNDFDDLSSHGKSYTVDESDYDQRADVTSRVQQAMLRNSCLTD